MKKQTQLSHYKNEIIKNKNLKNEIIIGFLLISLLVFSRLTSHLWNLTAVGGVALFAGAYFSRKAVALFVVFSGLLISDFFLGFHDQMIAVYFSYALISGLGFLLSLKSSRGSIFLMSLTGALLFFLITNFSVWYGSLMYPQTASGLMESYMMGLPFFRNQIAADIISAIILFELAKLPSPASRTVRLKS